MPVKARLKLMGTLVMLCLVASPGSAQECREIKTVTIDSSRFDINEDGTVTDIETGLTWQRCALGQRWSGATCIGEAELYTWEEANHSYNPLAGKRGEEKNWRLPKLNELAGIVDIRCKSPRIDLELFPNTLSQPFWTTNNAPGSVEEAYTLSFGAEGVSRTKKTERHYVRLVSGRD